VAYHSLHHVCGQLNSPYPALGRRLMDTLPANSPQRDILPGIEAGPHEEVKASKTLQARSCLAVDRSIPPDVWYAREDEGYLQGQE
jgi:hypothetical protein